jgi:hypothetical protein
VENATLWWYRQALRKVRVRDVAAGRNIHVSTRTRDTEVQRCAKWVPVGDVSFNATR